MAFLIVVLALALADAYLPVGVEPRSQLPWQSWLHL